MERCWTINGRFLTQSVTGVQRYAREIVSALDQLIIARHPLARGLDIELVCPHGISDPPRLQVVRLREVGRMNGHIWEQALLPAVSRRSLISLCNTGPIAAVRHIVCIHDVNTRLCPLSYALPFRLLYRTLQPALGRTARAVTTVSQFSAGEIARYGIAASGKISVIPNGHEHALRWQPMHSAATRAAAGSNTIVVLGSPAWHKNVGLILDLAPRLAAAGLRIAVAGLRNARVFNPAAKEESARSVVWLGRLSDDALAALLQDSLCLAFPSFTEGFGLPPLEAMALGCPVIASDRASLPEICGDAALYAPPTEPNLWFDRLVRLYQDKSLRARLADRGRARARQYSWWTSAIRYLGLMAHIDGLTGEESAGTQTEC